MTSPCFFNSLCRTANGYQSMKKYFLFLCGLFLVTNAAAATPGCHSSSASDHERPGLAIHIDSCRILSGCSSRIITAPGIENEKEIAQIPNGEGCDADSFDPEMELLFCTSGNATLTIAQQFSTTDFKTADTATPQQGNRARAP